MHRKEHSQTNSMSHYHPETKTVQRYHKTKLQGRISNEQRHKNPQKKTKNKKQKRTQQIKSNNPL